MMPHRVAMALQEDGWYVRSEIVWGKPNPMPESVTDRPTKSHEMIFLLTKSARYYFDADAVREPVTQSSLDRISQPNFANQTGGPKDYANGTNPNRSARKTLENFAARNARPEPQLPEGSTEVGGNPRGSAGRNIRSVWTIATRPYSGAHFAVFPPELPERCIKAGSPINGVILDPFAGSGTTGMVAQKLGRRAILIDLNPEYLKQQMQRNAQTPLGLDAA